MSERTYVEVDADFEWLPTCQFPGTGVGSDGQLKDCGDTAVAKVWFSEDGSDAWLACWEHWSHVFMVTPESERSKA